MTALFNAAVNEGKRTLSRKLKKGQFPFSGPFIAFNFHSILGIIIDYTKSISIFNNL